MIDINNAKSWTVLEVFSLTVSSGADRLFANGLQQVRIRVAIRAVDAEGEIVRLSNKEMNSLELVDHYSRQAIAYTESPSITPAGRWSWGNNRDSRYRYFPTGQTRSAQEEDEIDLMDISTNSNVQYRDVYVRTRADAPLHIGARLTRGDRVIFTTSEDSSVTLTPVTSPTYRPGDYNFQALEVQSNGTISFDYRPFGLNVGGVNMEFRSFHMASLVKLGNSNIITPAGFTGFARPGEYSINYSSGIVIGPQQIRSGYVKVGQPVVVVSRALVVHPGQLSAPVREASISAVDMYGNNHRINVRYKSTDSLNTDLELY